MKKTILAFSLIALLPVVATAQNNIGACGWGSKLFAGQRGIAPQVLGATTNGTSGNQTFAITSGTSGCTQDGMVESSWKTAAFIDNNMNKLAKDISRGQGESLDSLANLLNVDSADRVAFNDALKNNFSNLFPNTEVTTDAVRANLVAVLNNSAELAQYSANV
jgi:hypothetical protein